MSAANAVAVAVAVACDGLWTLPLTSGPVGGAEKRRLEGGCARGLSERSELQGASCTLSLRDSLRSPKWLLPFRPQRPFEPSIARQRHSRESGNPE